LITEELAKIEENSMTQTTRVLNAEPEKTEEPGKTAENLIEVIYSTGNVLLLPVSL
jgi:hypothetical protein